MKTIHATIALIVCILAASALAGKDKGETVTCGEAIGDAPMVSLEHVMKFPQKYVGKTVIVTGTAAEVCQKKGCWMRLTPGEGEGSVRMTFKDYGFFVPKDAGGMRVRAEGVFELQTLDKEHAQHLVDEGAKLKLNPDGTANELAFVATGVELRKPAKDKS